MKQTAVEYLHEYLSISLGIDRIRLLENLFERAIEMEKEQIQEAFINGEVARDRIDSIEYYKETYGK